MFKLLVALSAALFLVLLIGGRDNGQQRMGLTGAYDADLPDIPAAIEAVEPTPVVAPAPAAPPAEVVTRAVTPEARPALQPTPVAFGTAPESSQPSAPAGLTLALPLVEAERAADPAPLPADRAGPQVNYVMGSNVNVREGPSAQSAVLDRLARGEAVTVLGSDTPGWSMVRIEGDGIEGFVASRYLSATPPATSLFPASD